MQVGEEVVKLKALKAQLSEDPGAIRAAIATQGDLVRALKAEGAPKEKVLAIPNPSPDPDRY
jgi:hypothetical protein